MRRYTAQPGYSMPAGPDLARLARMLLEEVSLKEVTIVVVQFSEGFTDVWPELAGELGAGLRVIGKDEPWTTGPDVAAVILAASGVERETVDWLEGHPQPEMPCMAVGSDTGHRIAAQVVKAGAREYFVLPDDIEILRNAAAVAVERRQAALRRAASRAASGNAEAFAELIGESEALKAALARAALVLPHKDTTVLITGETGTGKELLARGLHEGSPRREAPFVPVNCTALPGNLLESELFGHERGAFTDAHAAKPGLFEVATGGTLFLDEIGHLAIEMQAKLLRVLDDKKVRRVGGTSLREVDVRIVAATNEDLERAVQEGNFRKDLFFRIGVINLSLPPLRERGDDVIVIAEALLERLASRHGRPRPPLDDDLRSALLAYHWPGNVRELKNSVERALLLSPPGELMVEELLHRSPAPPAANGPIPFPAPLREITAAAARSTLDLCDGNQSEAARRLGISRARLARLMDHTPLTA